MIYSAYLKEILSTSSPPPKKKHPRKQERSVRCDGEVADTSALEHQIDMLVYKLYGLTEEEIKIVENSAK